jgi:hypothetical protein
MQTAPSLLKPHASLATIAWYMPGAFGCISVQTFPELYVTHARLKGFLPQDEFLVAPIKHGFYFCQQFLRAKGAPCVRYPHAAIARQRGHTSKESPLSQSESSVAT